nr:hypothetical protein [Alysiella crassa]
MGDFFDLKSFRLPENVGKHVSGSLNFCRVRRAHRFIDKIK